MFNAKPFETIVVEDSQRGLESAKRADLDCIVVKNEFTLNQDFKKADFFIESLDELKKLL